MCLQRRGDSDSYSTSEPGHRPISAPAAFRSNDMIGYWRSCGAQNGSDSGQVEGSQQQSSQNEDEALNNKLLSLVGRGWENEDRQNKVTGRSTLL